VNSTDGGDHVHTLWDAENDSSTIHFNSNFFAPNPVTDVTLDPGRYTGLFVPIIFSNAPLRVFDIGMNRAVRKPLLSDPTSISLQVRSNGSDPGLALFDGVTHADVTQIRWVPFQVTGFEEW
jgi:hypothetical protein